MRGLMARSNARTAAAAPSGQSHTADTTARKSAPASTRRPQFSGAMPPMATQGTVTASCHQRRIAGSARARGRLVDVG